MKFLHFKDGKLRFKPWIKVAGPRWSNGKPVVDVSINRRHPGFWIFVFKEAKKSYGINVYHPKVLYRLARMILREYVQ